MDDDKLAELKEGETVDSEKETIEEGNTSVEVTEDTETETHEERTRRLLAVEVTEDTETETHEERKRRLLAEVGLNTPTPSTEIQAPAILESQEEVRLNEPTPSTEIQALEILESLEDDVETEQKVLGALDKKDLVETGESQILVNTVHEGGYKEKLEASAFQPGQENVNPDNLRIMAGQLPVRANMRESSLEGRLALLPSPPQSLPPSIEFRGQGARQPSARRKDRNNLRSSSAPRALAEQLPMARALDIAERRESTSLVARPAPDSRSLLLQEDCSECEPPAIQGAGSEPLAVSSMRSANTRSFRNRFVAFFRKFK